MQKQAVEHFEAGGRQVLTRKEMQVIWQVVYLLLVYVCD